MTDYRALVTFAKQSGVLDPSTAGRLAGVTAQAGGRTAEAARELRETAAAVLYAVVDDLTPSVEAVQKLELHAQSARQHQELLCTRSAGQSRFLWG